MDLGFVSHALIAVAIGISVSMDVAGFNLSMAGNTAYSSEPIRRSLMHAFWHGLFISIGIGGIAFLSDFGEWIIAHFDLAWLFQWIAVLLPWFDPIKFPIWFLTIVGVLLWFKLYWNKIRGTEDDDHLPSWFGRVLRLFSVKTSQLMYVLVAMDMWFLTPLLKSIVQDYNVLGKIAFVAVVTITVYSCSLLAMRYGQKLIKTKHAKSLFYWMVTFVWAEPVITGYFTMRAAWWAFTGELKSDTDFVVITALVVTGLCFGKFKFILDGKWQEAESTIANLDKHQSAQRD